MKPDQQKFLFSRLSDAMPDSYEYVTEDPPPSVTEARRIVANWERLHAAKRKRAYKKVSRHAERVREAIYSGDWNKALAAVKEFEKRYL